MHSYTVVEYVTAFDDVDPVAAPGGGMGGQM